MLPHGFLALVGLEITLIRNQSAGRGHLWWFGSVLSGEPACSELDFLERRQAPALSGKEGSGYEQASTHDVFAEGVGDAVPGLHGCVGRVR
ncbi:hypothetical protein D3C78_1731990 [compost metagenome]